MVQGLGFRVWDLPASDRAAVATKGPMWGHPMLVLGALCSFLEPFCGYSSPKIDKVSEELTLRYHHEEPWVGRARTASRFAAASQVSLSLTHTHILTLHSHVRAALSVLSGVYLW